MHHATVTRSPRRRVLFKGMAWPNSLLAHTLALVIGVVLLITAGGLTIIFVSPSPSSGFLSTYEIARQFRHLPISKNNPPVTMTREAEMPPASNNPTTVLLTRALAAQLGRPPDAVRMYVDEDAQRSISNLEREFRLYGAEGHFDPPVVGSFRAAVRESDGSWSVLSRTPPSRMPEWRVSSIYWLIGWLAVVIPLGWWFSRRLARAIREFTVVAERVGRGERVPPFPLRGPAEIREATQSINEMQARLGRYVTERTSVVGAIAHDLRAPLSRLNFHLAEAPEAIRKSAEAEIREMEQMIMVTLDFVEQETRPQRREPVDLALLVEGVVDNFADMGRDVRMGETSHATINGDPLMLKRLFANLIDNAVKYGQRAIVHGRLEDGFAVIDVEDGGGGMKPADIERAFEPFYRVEPSRNRRTGGVGLGLSIVRSVAVVHGGSVELINVHGAGLRARVRLPLMAERPSRNS